MSRSRVPRLISAVLGAALVMAAACSSSGGAPSTIAGTTFAPELWVDTTTMTPIRGGGWYRDLTTGSGPAARDGSTLTLYYSGMFPDGTVFDATSAPNPPVRVVLGRRQVIAGWDRGLEGMRAGGQRLLVLPPSLGYGARGNARIPPNSVLVFVVELVQVQ